MKKILFLILLCFYSKIVFSVHIAPGAASSVPSSGITGTTLPSTIVNSSLTRVGTLTRLAVTNTITGNITGTANYISASGIRGTTLPANLTTSSLTTFTGRVWGEYVVTYNTGSTAIALTGSYVTVNVPLVAGVHNTTTNITMSGGVFTVVLPGFYTIEFHGNLDKANDVDDIEGGISINGSTPFESSEFRLDATLAGFNPVHSIEHVSLVAGDKVCIKMKNDTASRNVIPRSCVFYIKKDH